MGSSALPEPLVVISLVIWSGGRVRCSDNAKQLHIIHEVVCNKKESESEIELTQTMGDVCFHFSLTFQ
jgi:hypothetical protein